MAVITISRQYGSKGDDVANLVAEKLNYRIFDKTLMAQVASEVGLSENEIVDFQETNYRVRNFLERLLPRSRVVAEVGTWTVDTTGARIKEVQKLDETRSITMVKGVIQAAYKQGDVIIVGRGGQAILKGMGGVLHVRIVAPLDFRIETVHYDEHLHPKEAEDLVARHDRAAEDYVKRFYGVDSSDPTLYHMVINTGHWGVETAADLIVEAVKALPATAPSS